MSGEALSSDVGELHFFIRATERVVLFYAAALRRPHNVFLQQLNKVCK